ncbi:MAG: glycosyltransferase involved in cell wall biosynthesis [Bacteroidia bacterium]|jgi:glycosyltransferase involved in cell wall biosynthesis
MLKQVELSVIILCYRSGKAVPGFVNKVEKHIQSLTENYELVLVANYVEGSDDRTRDYVYKIADANPKCKVLCKPKQGMMGWDMRSGMDAATGTYICVIDGDGQFPIESISSCFEEIRTGKYDLVKTYRTKRGDGIYRRVISKTYNVLFSILFSGIGSKDANSKPKILKASAYEQMNLKSDDWFIDAEIMLNVRDKKMTFFELPIEFYELEGRSSFVKPAAIWEFIKNLYDYRAGK